MKICSIGNGFIASHLKYDPIFERVSPTEKDIKTLLDWYKPDVIVNCVGRTGTPNIDWCESHQDETYTANVLIPVLLAAECEKRSIRFIHLGSGCIFYGQSPHTHVETHFHYYDDIVPYTKTIDTGWRETDTASPLSYYSKSKWDADTILNEMNNTTILRLRMPISSKHSPRNLISKLIKYNKVLDEPNSMTFVDDLVNAINFSIEKNLYGIYHVASPQPITHPMLLEEYKKYVPNHKYTKINKDELNSLVIAPRSNCILNVDKIVNLGFQFGDVDMRVRECIKGYISGEKHE